MSEMTPEEKLLSIIRRKDALKKVPRQGENVSREETKTETADQETALSPVRAEEPADYEKTFWEEAVYRNILYKELKDFKFRREDFIIIFLIAALSILINWLIPYTVRHRGAKGDLPPKALLSIIDDIQSSTETDFGSKYGGLFSREDIFTAIPAPQIQAQEQQGAPGPTVYEKIKEIRLAGILWSEVPPKAIIEVRNIGSVRYVKVGEEIEGLQVSDIQQGRVVVKYKGQTAELSL